MKKRWKRLLSLALAAALVIGFYPGVTLRSYAEIPDREPRVTQQQPEAQEVQMPALKTQEPKTEAVAAFTIHPQSNENNLTAENLATPNNRDYDKTVQPLINAPAQLPEGTVSLDYSLDNSAWGPQIPTGDTAGIYTVYVRYNGDGNHETFVKSVETTISTVNVTVYILGNNSEFTYDGEAHTVTGYTFTTSTASYGEEDFTFSGNGTVTRTDAGTSYMGLTPIQFTNVNPNYAAVTFLVTDGYVRINRVHVNVTVTGHTDTATYDRQTHTVTGYDFSADNAMYADSSDNYTFTGTATATRTDAGTASMGLSADQFTNTNSNFTVTFTVLDGWQKVEPKVVDPVDITVLGGDVYYNGEAWEPAILVFDGEEEIPESEYTVVYSNNENAGAAVIALSNVEGNYVVSGSTTFRILPVPVTVTVENRSKIYGETDPEWTVTVTGGIEGGDFEYTLMRETGENVGEYAIYAVPVQNSNYDVTTVPGTLTIQKRAASVSAGQYIKTCGQVDPKFTATVTGAMAGETLNYVLSRDLGEEAGEYEIRVDLGENPNYALTAVNGALYINFVDVPEKSFFFEAVRWGVVNGITSGTGKANFSPKIGITRAQAVTFLWRLAGSPEPNTTQSIFTDVWEYTYYYKAVLWANERGITSGTSATAFSPNQICTRAHIMTFLWRYAGSPEPAGSCPFADIKPGAYFEKPSTWAYENGVTSGTSEDTFSPYKDCTRSEMIVFLWAFAKLL